MPELLCKKADLSQVLSCDQYPSLAEDGRTYDLAKFSLADLIHCGATVRKAEYDSASMEEVGNKIVRYLYEQFVDPETGERDFALVRLFKTHSFGDLDDHLRASAQGLMKDVSLSDDTKCLSLLATAGDLPEWRIRTGSRGHQAIPLPSEQIVSRIPMISQLISQFGLQLGSVIEPNPELLIELDERTYNIFFVPEAPGSPYIPAQEQFVARHGIQSALGFGGMLPTGNLFAVILFSKTKIPRATAEIFQTIALNTKVAILPFEESSVFHHDTIGSEPSLPEVNSEFEKHYRFRQYRSKAAALEELGKVYDRTVIQQSERLRHAVDQLEQSNEELVAEVARRKQLEDEREKLHEQMLQISRQAGMSEIATGVLHNVGNVLNSVNVSANVISELAQGSQVEGLAKAVGLIEEHADDLGDYVTRDQRGKHLPGFLSELARNLHSERDTVLQEIAALLENIEHIKQIISVQQSYATICGAMAPVDLASLVDDAVQVNSTSLRRHEVEVRQEIVGLPSVTTDKNKVLQILVNLISNAKHALRESTNSSRRITIRARMQPDEYVRIEVEDNGVGIPAENLTKAFVHGFTTKRDGHGFGLHSSALAAKELGGTLTAQSDGSGSGARFTLELPVIKSEDFRCEN